MASNGRNNVSPAIMANQRKLGSILFTDLEEGEKLEYVPVADANLLKDLMQTPDVPIVSKMDSTNGGKKSMQVLRWIIEQVWGFVLLGFAVITILLVVSLLSVSIAFGWETGLALAAWTLGG